MAVAIVQNKAHCSMLNTTSFFAFNILFFIKHSSTLNTLLNTLHFDQYYCYFLYFL